MGSSPRPASACLRSALLKGALSPRLQTPGPGSGGRLRSADHHQIAPSRAPTRGSPTRARMMSSSPRLASACLRPALLKGALSLRLQTPGPGSSGRLRTRPTTTGPRPLPANLFEILGAGWSIPPAPFIHEPHRGDSLKIARWGGLGRAARSTRPSRLGAHQAPRTCARNARSSCVTLRCRVGSYEYI